MIFMNQSFKDKLDRIIAKLEKSQELPFGHVPWEKTEELAKEGQRLLALAKKNSNLTTGDK